MKVAKTAVMTVVQTVKKMVVMKAFETAALKALMLVVMTTEKKDAWTVVTLVVLRKVDLMADHLAGLKVDHLVVSKVLNLAA